MILTKDLLTKPMKKGRLEAISLLNKFAETGQLPQPHFEYEARGTTKRRWHFFKVRFRVPRFLQDMDRDSNMMLWEYSRHGDMVFGSGKDTNKQFAKSLAALEVVHQLEEALSVKRNGLADVLQAHLQEIRDKQAALEATPVTQEIQGVSWYNLPMDAQFPGQADRKGRIIFSQEICKKDPTALLGARAITLAARKGLPKVEHHSNHRDQVELQNWANILASGKIRGVNGPVDADLCGLSKPEAERVALHEIGRQVEVSARVSGLVGTLEARPESFGMAKLFVRLPKHRFEEIKELVDDIEEQAEANAKQYLEKSRPASPSNHKNDAKVNFRVNEKGLEKRIASFRSHQQQLSLPVDQVEERIPGDAAVTIVRGGTGSGKTTRYPLMLSLFQENAQKIVVAQPRRLACQAAAQRVAYEQDSQIGQATCPIGYSIRFDSKPSSSSQGNTIDFETPGVILRRATQDPLLSSLTHLVIDEVHERNADMDMLLALAKQAQRHRKNHPVLEPLKIVLMSATLDTDQWETYFQSNGKVSLVDVPDARRFPIDIFHAGEKGFPKTFSALRWLQKGRTSADEQLDEILCEACAELILHLLRDSDLRNGSILCFLPGMDEIQTVRRLIRKSRQKIQARICLLHSSLDSREQARVFQDGPKIILSTNITETSLTIPDVKIVIDSGRERQYSLMESGMSNTTVVGSQLATVDISQASAKQRAGRAGRVSAGTCYRLYTRQDFESTFSPFTLPEMQRMELSQLVLHSLSLYHPSSGHPLSLLLGSPDPPSHLRLRQTLYAMSQQSLVTIRSNSRDLELIDVDLTPLGTAVASIPASPRVGRMLFMGLALRAIDSALTIAALLSVPKAFTPVTVPDRVSEEGDDEEGKILCSDVVLRLLAFEEYMQLNKEKRKKPQRVIFDQVLRVRKQLEKSIIDHLPGSIDWEAFNSNNRRVAAQAALICGATPHIAHLVAGRGTFATRDAPGTARMHPNSINFDHRHRAHWYLYHELRTTKAPYLHVTTAASPLELALFCDSTAGIPQKQKDPNKTDEEEEWTDPWDEDRYNKEEWLFIADQWVPVTVSNFTQRKPFVKLRFVLNFHMLHHVASDPGSFVKNKKYEQLVLCIFSSMEQERIPL